VGYRNTINTRYKNIFIIYAVFKVRFGCIAMWLNIYAGLSEGLPLTNECHLQFTVNRIYETLNTARALQLSRGGATEDHMTKGRCKLAPPPGSSLS
jgi:hypothetical protein